MRDVGLHGLLGLKIVSKTNWHFIQRYLKQGGGKVKCITKKVYLSKKQLYKCIYNICSSCH